METFEGEFARPKIHPESLSTYNRNRVNKNRHLHPSHLTVQVHVFHLCYLQQQIYSNCRVWNCHPPFRELTSRTTSQRLLTIYAGSALFSLQSQTRHS